NPENRGDHILADGDSLVFKYRLYLHAGNAGEAGVSEKYNNFINAPYPVSEDGKQVFEIPPGH
ncbi:hypothetical protein ACFL4W_05805, partial [Planctomycetota bacterium]